MLELNNLNYFVFVYQDMCQGARDYADIIHDKLKEHGYYDDEGQFDVTEQVSSFYRLLMGDYKNYM